MLEKEGLDFRLKDGVEMLDNVDVGASIASGSFGVEQMALIPTSMNKLAKIAHGIADDLITRAASVMIKERKTLLLAPREMPLSSIALENMLKLSQNNVLIAKENGARGAVIEALNPESKKSMRVRVLGNGMGEIL